MATEATKSKPLMSGFMKSTQVLELDGCTRCQECMKWCPAYAVRPDRPGVAPMQKAATWREMLGKQRGLKAKVLGEETLRRGGKAVRRGSLLLHHLRRLQHGL